MPKKNLLAFIVISALLIASWWWVRNELLPPQQPNESPVAKKPDELQVAKDKDKDKKSEPAPAKEPVKAKEAVEVKKESKEAARAVAEDNIPLGDDDPKLGYYLVAKLTSQGAGVQSVMLPKFHKANGNGQPVYYPDGKPMPLELVQDDPISPSYLMMHYPNPASTNEKWNVSALLAQSVWKIEKSSTTAELSQVSFSCEVVAGLRIVKTFTLKPREYHIGLRLEMQDLRDPKGSDKGERTLRYQLTGSHGLPVEGLYYSSIYRFPMIGYVDDSGRLWRDLGETQHNISFKEGGDKIEPRLAGKWMQFAGVATQFFSSLIVVDDLQLNDLKPRKVLDYCRPTLESQEVGGVIDRFDNRDPKHPRLVIRTKEALPTTHVFVLLPRTKLQYEQEGFKEGEQVFVSWYEPETGAPERVATFLRAGGVRRAQLDDITVRVVSDELKLDPGKSVVHQYLLYHGPSKVQLLGHLGGDQSVDPALVERYSDTLHLKALTDYRSPGIFGEIASKIMWTDLLILTTRFMHGLLYYLHQLIPNYGLSIILLTLLVRGAMFPISRRSALLSQRMQALGPEIKKVQEKFKDDPQAKTAEIMALYRKHGVSPFGGCLPVLMQMPFFLGLYYCLQESVHFRLASFLWMDNLAAPDMLLRWGDGIPIISDPDNYTGSFFSFLYLGPYFNLLPVIAVTLMLIQQKMMTPPPADEQQEMQQKMMKYMFVFMGIMFYKVAAGLCIYFTVSSLWGLCERKLLPKKKPAEALASAAPASAPASSVAKTGRGKAKPDKKDKKPDGAMQKVKDWWAEVLKQAQKK